MLEYNLATLFVSTLKAGFTARGYPSMVVRQTMQPRQAGTPQAASVFFHVVGGPHRHGWPSKVSAYDSVSQTLKHTETQIWRTRFQFGALSPQSPANVALPTTSDYLRLASDILQHDDAISAFAAQAVTLERITDITPNWIENDKGQHDASPSFDIIVLHTDSFVQTVPGIDTFAGNVSTI